MKNNIYKLTKDWNYIKIFINNILHLQIPYSKKYVLQSWREDVSLSKFCIQISNNKNGKIISLLEYDNRQKWESILKLWNDNII